MVKANPAVAPAGCVVNEICEAVADPTVNDDEVPVTVPCLAVSVVVWASYRVIDGRVATPLVKVTEAG